MQQTGKKQYKDTTKSMQRRIGDIVRKNCVKAKNADIIMEKDKILERWTKYIGDLYDDEERVKYQTQKNFDDPPF